VINGEAGDSLLDTYEKERREVALSTMRNTNRNADEIFDVVSSAMENDWDKVRALIAQSRRQGTGLGQDLGVTYSQGAFVSDGSEAAVTNDPINDYQPSARPGSRAPHLRINRKNGQFSTLDFFGRNFVLLTGTDFPKNASTGNSVNVFQNGKDFTADGFEELYDITRRGAVLVRPDGYVGARWPEARENFRREFQAAFQSILGAPVSE